MNDEDLHQSFLDSERYKDSPTERFARELHEEGERGGKPKTSTSKDGRLHKNGAKPGPKKGSHQKKPRKTK